MRRRLNAYQASNVSSNSSNVYLIRKVFDWVRHCYFLCACGCITTSFQLARFSSLESKLAGRRKKHNNDSVRKYCVFLHRFLDWKVLEGAVVLDHLSVESSASQPLVSTIRLNDEVSHPARDQVEEHNSTHRKTDLNQKYIYIVILKKKERSPTNDEPWKRCQ